TQSKDTVAFVPGVTSATDTQSTAKADEVGFPSPSTACSIRKVPHSGAVLSCKAPEMFTLCPTKAGFWLKVRLSYGAASVLEIAELVAAVCLISFWQALNAATSKISDKRYRIRMFF